MSVVLDTPAQISGWVYMSAISQITLEIKTGTNFYGKVSAYKGVRGRIIPAEMLPARATRLNKIMALTMLVWGQPSGPVVDSARDLLGKIAAEEGIVFVLTEA